ncbi:hypothetical protein ACLOJK_019356 [Asimina triloba]
MAVSDPIRPIFETLSRGDSYGSGGDRAMLLGMQQSQIATRSLEEMNQLGDLLQLINHHKQRTTAPGCVTIKEEEFLKRRFFKYELHSIWHGTRRDNLQRTDDGGSDALINELQHRLTSHVLWHALSRRNSRRAVRGNDYIEIL